MCVERLTLNREDMVLASQNVLLQNMSQMGCDRLRKVLKEKRLPSPLRPGTSLSTLLFPWGQVYVTQKNLYLMI